MARLLPRSPTPGQEHAYHQWAAEYLGYNCDRCGAVVPEASPQIHDVWDPWRGKHPKRVYCSPYCYHEHNNTEIYQRGEL